MARSSLVLVVTAAAVLSGLALFSLILVVPMVINELYTIELELTVHRVEFNVISNELWTAITQQSTLMRPVRSVQRKRRQYADDSYGGGSEVAGGPSNKCPPGPKGPPGDNGENGMNGDDGYAGLPGRDGDTFATTPTNTPCEPCPPGPVGFPGYKGIRGPRGSKGEKGVQGQPGRDGAVGDEGPDGDTGYVGDEGPQGEKGAPGKLGIKGRRGPRGKKGETGPVGPIGDEGEPGERGDDGLRGNRGEIGPIGPPGKQGRPGRRGRAGNQGAKGADGEYCDCPDRGAVGGDGKGTEGGVLGSYSDIERADLGGQSPDGVSGIADASNSVILGVEEGDSAPLASDGGQPLNAGFGSGRSLGGFSSSRSGKKSSSGNYRIPSITPFSGKGKTGGQSKGDQRKDTVKDRQTDDKSDIFGVFDGSDNGSPPQFSDGAESSDAATPYSRRARAKALRRKHL